MRASMGFGRVRRLRADWDGHGAEIPCEASIERAQRFWTELSQDGKPPPEVMASSEGGVYLEWDTPDALLVVEFEPSGKTSLLARTADFDVDGPLDEFRQEFDRAASLL